MSVHNKIMNENSRASSRKLHRDQSLDCVPDDSSQIPEGSQPLKCAERCDLEPQRPARPHALEKELLLFFLRRARASVELLFPAPDEDS